MKHKLTYSFLLAWFGVVLVLTLAPGDVPVVNRLFAILRTIRFGDLIGHMGLFASLTLVLWLGFSLTFTPRRALLVANWLGVFVVGFGASYFWLPLTAIASR